MLSKIAPGTSDELLLGFETSDDAAIYRLDDETAAVLTVDFFTPIVDDPYDFGRITAANALSDVYAMGGKPLVALNLLAFPCSMGPEIVGEVVRGGADKVREAGAVTVGGHTIDDNEPKFGLSVFGTVHPDSIIRNHGCRPGDVLFLTKPIGTGVMMTALKRGLETEDSVRTVVESMAELNRDAATAMSETGVRAATDVTGFGLLGHLHEMVEASGCAAELDYAEVPLFDGVEEYASSGCWPGRTKDIIAWADPFVGDDRSDEDAHRNRMLVLCDPQTSGGMLVAVSLEKAELFSRRFEQLSGRSAARIGRVVAGESGHVSIK